MISYIRHDDIDPARWDEAMLQAKNGMIYGRSWFLDRVSPGWDALVEGSYQSVMPLTWRKKAGISYLCQPPFTQQLGVFSAGNLTSRDIGRFMQAIPASFRYVDIFLNATNPGPDNSHAHVHERLTHHLPLEGIPGTLSYSENLRRNLKKAAAQNFAPQAVSMKEVISLFRRTRGKAVNTLGAREYNLLEKLGADAAARNLMTVNGIRNGNKLVAGACFLESDREYIFFFSATGEEGKSSGAMSCIIDHFIRNHGGPKLLDFEGSMDKNLSRFYKSFGAHEIVYLHVQSNRLPRMLRWLKK